MWKREDEHFFGIKNHAFFNLHGAEIRNYQLTMINDLYC